MDRAALLSTFCWALVLAGTSPAAALTNVVTLAVNVNSGTATCSDWFAGTPSIEYLTTLQTYAPGVTPSMSCRQSAQVVHSMELIGSEPGANFLFDDPRKVAEAVGELRNLNVTNRISLYIDFLYAEVNPEDSQALFETLDANIRSGDFLSKVINVTYPLLKAAVYQEVFSAGVAC